MSWFYSAATITVGIAVVLRLLWWAYGKTRQLPGRPALALAPDRMSQARRHAVLKEMARRAPRSAAHSRRSH